MSNHNQLSKKIDIELHRASLEFIAKSDAYVNERAIEKIYNRGYIKKAMVTQVTKIDDIEHVTIRADGARVEFEVEVVKLNLVYGNQARY